MGKKKKRQEKQDRGQGAPRGWLALPLVLLLLTGLGSSVYLTYLHLEVHAAGGGEVQSFCAISEGFNCVTVATSEYSTFLGVPVAVYGMEFYLLGLAAVILSGIGLWSVRRWDSLLFVGMALSLPVCAGLFWVSISCIQSVCIMCLLVYGVNLLAFLLLLVSGWGRLGEMVTAGPRELLRVASGARGAMTLLLVGGLLVSQFFWMPGMLHGEARRIEAGTTQAWHGLPTEGQTIGPKDAPVQIEEFTDYQCPYCGKAHEVMMQVLKQFPGKIHLIHRDYPLDMACNPRITTPFHEHACQAAYYARCAAAQDKYWPYEALLFRNRERLEHEDLLRYASTVGLDVAALKRCVRSEETFKAVREDLARGVKRNVSGTPTVFVNGEAVVGLRPPAFWVEKISEILQKR